MSGQRGARKRIRSTLAMGLVAALTCGGIAHGDEPGLFGRLFRRQESSQRRGNPPTAKRQAIPGDPLDPAAADAAPSLLPPPVSGSPSLPASSLPDVGAPAVPPLGSGNTPPTTPLFPAPTAGLGEPPSNPASPVIRPQPRNSRAATEADPLLTRVTIGRTNDGSRFGMFLHVYADGTVIDSDGIRSAGPDAMRTLAQALQDPELGRVRGHCGGPPTDFVEQVYVVVYRKKLNGLVANSFSYSGNTAGCDSSVRNLHAAVEAFQAKIAPPGSAAPAVPAVGAADAAPTGPVFSSEAPGSGPAPAPETLSLTPGN